MGSRVFLTQCRVAEYLSLADQVRKAVLFEIAAAGFRASAVDGDEFVIEVAKTEMPSASVAVVGAAEKAARKLLSRLAAGCCICRSAEHW